MFGAPGNRVFALLCVLLSGCVHTATDGSRAAVPRDAAGKLLTGVVRLRVSIDAEGRVTEAVVISSSGSAALDLAARDAVSKTRFRGTGQPLTIPYTYQFAND